MWCHHCQDDVGCIFHEKYKTVTCTTCGAFIEATEADWEWMVAIKGDMDTGASDTDSGSAKCEPLASKEQSVDTSASNEARVLQYSVVNDSESLSDMEDDFLDGGALEIGSGPAKCEPLAFKVHQAVDTSASDEARVLQNSVENDPESLSDIDDMGEKAAKEAAAAAAAKEAYNANLAETSGRYAFC